MMPFGTSCDGIAYDKASKVTFRRVTPNDECVGVPNEQANDEVTRP